MVHFAALAADALLVRETARVYVPPSPSPAPGPVPFRDADAVQALEELEEKIVVLAAHLHAGDHRLLILVADFDRLRGWEMGGHRSCAHWLAFRTGFDLGACRERVRVMQMIMVRRLGRGGPTEAVVVVVAAVSLRPGRWQSMQR